MRGDGFAQKIIALFRTIAAEGFLNAHFGNCLLHCFNNGRSQRQGYVADTHFYNFLFRVGCRKFCHFMGNLRKQVTFF